MDPNKKFLFTSDSKYWVDKILAEAKKHPEDIEILSPGRARRVHQRPYPLPSFKPEPGADERPGFS